MMKQVIILVHISTNSSNFDQQNTVKKELPTVPIHFLQ